MVANLRVFTVEIGPKQTTDRTPPTFTFRPLKKVEGLRDGDNLENETFSEQHKVGF